MKNETIAFLLKDAERLEDCLASMAPFFRCGARIQLLLLGIAPTGTDQNGTPWRERIAAYPVEVYGDIPGEPEGPEIAVVDTAALALLIKKADMVLPL